MSDDTIDTSDVPELDGSFFEGAKLLVPKDRMLVTMKVGEDDEEEEDNTAEERSLGFFEYLDGPHGHEVAQQVVKLFADFKTTVLDRTLQEKQQVLKYQQHVQTRMWIVQIIAFVVALSLAGFLTYAGKFDSAFAMLLGTLVGYFFGKGIKS
ncbi:MAG: hypothetical protein JOZ02_15795 [Acidobacteria bacterium]|nr:hypothetical protein [Acidobacteriota bacterium]